MTVIEIIDAFTFYGFDVIALGLITCIITHALKISLLKNCQRKVLTFIPFIVGVILYAAYAALVRLDLSFLLKEYVYVLEHGFSVGALATLYYVYYEQFIRGKNGGGQTQEVIATLISGYVPTDEVEDIAFKIAEAIKTDVMGDGALKTADILQDFKLEDVTENDIKLLSKLIIETLAHLKP